MSVETVFVVLAIIVVLVVGFGAFMNNFEKKQYTAEIAGLRADVAKVPGIGTQLAALGTSAPTPVTVTVNHAPVTLTAGSTPVASPSNAQVNGVNIPAGMTAQTFQQLITAISGIAGFLSSAVIAAAIATESDAWFGSLGPYFVQQLVAQAPAGSAVAGRVATYVSAHPVVEVTPTAGQMAAAQQAISGNAPAAPTA